MRFSSSSLTLIRRAFHGRPRALVAAVVAVASLGFASAGYLVWFTYDLTTGLPDRDALRGIGDMAQSTTILDARDRPVFTIFKEQRIEIPLEQMSPNFIKAVISVEDQRFFDHAGVDVFRVAGAVVSNLQAGRRAEGGSTITQQLARLSFLSRGKTYRRKLKEVIVAAYLESLYSKQDILQHYLNKVYFGDGLYGVEAAARGYLGKGASDLSVDEAALLAGLIQSPSSYAPTVNLDRAIARRNVVLQTMVDSGAIDAATFEQAKRAEVRLKNALEIKETFGLYFKEQVRRELVERFGWQRVYQGGLHVFTTIDAALQQAAETFLEQGLEDVEKRRGFKYPTRTESIQKPGSTPDYLQGALVAMDPATGHVSVMVGGRDFNDSRFNRATQAKRQSGSAFKPFVYAAAIEAGQSPATLITRLNEPIPTPQGGWLPEDGHSNADSMTLRAALRTSSNRAAVQLLTVVGIPNAVGYAQKLNVGTPPSVPSLALGAGDVTLMSLTAAYAAFANRGIVRTPVLIRRVQDEEGKVLFEDAGEARRAVSESTAFLMSSMLADVISAGTAYRARQAGFTLPAAGKTGTTNDYHDAWFVGFTPRLVTGVWVGFDAPRPIISNGYAGELAVPIWASFMKRATRDHKAEWFERPATVVTASVCRISGKVPTEGCESVLVASSDGALEKRSMIYTEYFVRGTQPTETCPVHLQPSFMDRLAGVFGRQEGTPVSAEGIGLTVPPPTSTVGSMAPAPPGEKDANDRNAKVGEPPKKRGFWSRLFGRRDKDEDKKKDEQRGKQDQKQPAGRPPGG